MPIYMDRHDITESVTAEDVAHLHQQDLKVQDQFCCRALTYWFDSKRKTAFCLIEAPDEQTLRTMHEQAHGQVPNQVIEVDPSLVESFLGRIGDPVKAPGAGLNIIDEPATRTILAIHIEPAPIGVKPPIAGKLTLENLTMQLLEKLRAAGGRLVRQSANQLLTSFPSIMQAFQASMDFLSIQKDGNLVSTNHSWTISMGMAAGVPVNGRDGFFADSSKLAERISRIAGGKLLVSADAGELIKLEDPAFQSKDPDLIFLSTKEEQFITLLMDHLDNSLEQPTLSVDDLTRPTRLSQSQLYRNLTGLTGKSPNAFIRDLRLQLALGLMGKQAASISAIAFQSGFTSSSYFTKCFQKRYGLLPSEYLAGHKIEKKGDPAHTFPAGSVLV